MSFNIDEFTARTETKRYFIKTNKFKAIIPLCSGLVGGQGGERYINISRDLEFWCHTSALPGVTLGTYDAPRYGYGGREKRPFAPIFQDAMFSFYGDADAVNLKLFTDWINLIQNYDLTNANPSQSKYNTRSINLYPYELTYKYEYAVPITVIVYDDSGRESYKVEYRDAFPLMVSDIRMNWQDTGLMQITVLITYTDWVRKVITPQTTIPLETTKDNNTITT